MKEEVRVIPCTQKDDESVFRESTPEEVTRLVAGELDWLIKANQIKPYKTCMNFINHASKDLEPINPSDARSFTCSADLEPELVEFIKKWVFLNLKLKTSNPAFENMMKVLIEKVNPSSKV